MVPDEGGRPGVAAAGGTVEAVGIQARADHPAVGVRAEAALGPSDSRVLELVGIEVFAIGAVLEGSHAGLVDLG